VRSGSPRLLIKKSHWFPVSKNPPSEHSEPNRAESSSKLHLQADSHPAPAAGTKMGTTTIETITVTRPMKVIAFTCCAITVIFLLATMGATDWVQSNGWQEGLFNQCARPGIPTPLPFSDGKSFNGCKRAHSAGYVRGAAALVVIAFLTDFFGTLLTGLGLRSTDPNKKYKYYRVAIYSLGVAILALFLALIIYPTSMTKDMEAEPPLDGGISVVGDLDFDNDGIPDIADDDDDNDGTIDSLDDDDDNDGIKDDVDDDDDNDGIPDEVELADATDADGDGVPDAADNDDDNDGVPDDQDTDDDNDGIPDHIDNDDDNDGIPDAFETDTDGDGIVDAEDDDDDGDGTPDSQDADSDDDDDDNDGVPDSQEAIDSDNDGVSDEMDNDDDNDGIPDHLDEDDDGDGVDDDEDNGPEREWNFGFGFGASWMCVILMFLSEVLLICDRESEEIFYKERDAEEGDGEEEEKEDA